MIMIRINLLDEDYISSLMNLMTAVFENNRNTAQYKAYRGTEIFQNEKLHSVLVLIDGIIKGKMNQILKESRKLGPLLGLEEGSIEIFEALTLMLRKQEESNLVNVEKDTFLEGEEKERLFKAVDVISDYLSKLARIGQPEKEAEFHKRVHGMVTSLFAAVYGNVNLFMDGAAMFNKRLTIMSDILKQMHRLREAKLDILSKILIKSDNGGVGEKLNRANGTFLHFVLNEINAAITYDKKVQELEGKPENERKALLVRAKIYCVI
jgi:hypothetical protein